MIRSQSFREPMPLGCDLHKCFSVKPSFHLGESGNKGGVGLGISRQLGSGKMVYFESKPY